MDIHSRVLHAQGRDARWPKAWRRDDNHHLRELGVLLRQHEYEEHRLLLCWVPRRVERSRSLPVDLPPASALERRSCSGPDCLDSSTREVCAPFQGQENDAPDNQRHRGLVDNYGRPFGGSSGSPLVDSHAVVDFRCVVSWGGVLAHGVSRQGRLSTFFPVSFPGHTWQFLSLRP